MKNYLCIFIVFLIAISLIVLITVFNIYKKNAFVRITSLENQTVIPNNLYSPLIEWEDSDLSEGEYLVEVKAGNDILKIKTDEKRIILTKEQFIPFLKHTVLRISVLRMNSSRIKYSDSVMITVSNHKFKDLIQYRLVEPLFNPNQEAMIKIINIENEKPSSYTLSESLCIGCHSYQNDSAAFNLRKNSDRRLMVYQQDKKENDSEQFKIGEFSFVSLSPDKKYLALTYKTKSKINIKKSYIEPFDMTYSSGDIAIMNLETKLIQFPDNISDPDNVEDMMSWSPDGKSLLFCKYFSDPNSIKINGISIYSVSFNGASDQKPVSVLQKQPSQFCYFPRYSPDGKWISFVSGDASAGFFARKSSDIWLYSIKDKKLKKLEFNKSGIMDSWHSWSSDSNWIVFSSNRSPDGLTACYLSRIDEKGKAYPPVKISIDSKHKSNLPEIIKKEFNEDQWEKLKNFLEKEF